MNKLMKYMSVLMWLVISCSSMVASETQSAENDIIGTWTSEDEDVKIQITKSDGKYQGKIIWSSESDVRVGHIMLKNFTYDEDKKKYLGILVQSGGGTASAGIVLLTKKKMEITGYKFFFSRTSEWTKVD